jgi:CheY-like chemotaxis protein
MIPRCLRKHERIEATEITQQIFWPTRVNQAALGQRTEMIRKTVPHSFRVSLLESRARHIHVLFTDIQMPGTMDGLALAHHTSEHWPWIGLLITSARPHPNRAAFPEKSRFLAKPYQHRHVIRHIRELAAA